MTDSPANKAEVHLTHDVLRKMHGERDRLRADLEQTTARLAHLEKRIEAAELLLFDADLGPLVEVSRAVQNALADSKNPLGHASQNPARQKWSAEVKRLLADVGHGMTTNDFKRAFAGTPLEADLGPYGNSLHSALRKMVLRGDLVKEGQYYCLPGQAPPDTATPVVTTASLIEAGILRILGDKRAGLPSGDLLDKLRQGEAAEQIRKNPTHVYNVLRRMHLQGKLEREGRLYRLPGTADEGTVELFRPRVVSGG